MYLGAMALTVAAGLATRRYGAHLPAFVATYGGDTLWALTVFLGIGALAPGWATWRVAAWALATAFLVEIGQLYRAPWIDTLRSTRLGALVLGQGFLWSDLPCYAAGVAIGAAIERRMCASACRPR